MTTPATSAHVGAKVSSRIVAACNAVGTFIEYWGFKGILGRVWMFLALHTEPQPQARIAAGLGVSRSLVSESIAELVRLGLVRATGPQRNAPYEALIDIWPTVADVLRSREWMILEQARLALEALQDELELADPATRATYNTDRIRLLLAMTEMAQGFLKLLITLRTPRAIRDLPQWLTRAADLLKRVSRLQ